MIEQKLGIKLRKLNRICPITGYKESAIKVGARVVVQTDRGIEIGDIVAIPRDAAKHRSRDVALKKVLRYATQEDLKKAENLEKLEAEAIRIGMEKFKEYEFPLKIIDAEYTFDEKRVVFYYKVEEGKKVPNLKDLTRDLSGKMQARIEMKQLSPRDEARICGGLGPCGKALCCAAWLTDPKHITVRMVKDQGLSISPTRTSGMCGRLMCCLGYEGVEPKKHG